MPRCRVLLAAAGVAVAVTAAAGPGSASATSRKVAIGDFRWSSPTVNVNLGDTVTWVWVGPDTQHSVTGLSANATQYDSDPGGRTPDHKPGDRFQVKFSVPGTYEFHCVLHGIVRGSVVVDPVPGDGAPSPDPDPPILGDLTAPEIDAVTIRGRTLKYTLDERATVTVDIVKQTRGRAVLVKTKVYRGHVGFNEALFPGGLTPGRYKVYLRAADVDNNQSKDAVVPLVVRPRR